MASAKPGIWHLAKISHIAGQQRALVTHPPHKPGLQAYATQDQANIMIAAGDSGGGYPSGLPGLEQDRTTNL